MSDALPINVQHFAPDLMQGLGLASGGQSLGALNPAGFAKGLFDAAQAGQHLGAAFGAYLDGQATAGASPGSVPGRSKGSIAISRLGGGSGSAGPNWVKQMLDATDEQGKQAEALNRNVFLGKASVQEAVIAQEKYQVYLELLLHTRKKLEEGVKQLMNYGV
jgi:flagellar hook-basal body complex protein FliE